MDAVEGSGEDQGVVGAEVLEAGGEGAVVDEAAGFVDYEEGEDDPGLVLVSWSCVMWYARYRTYILAVCCRFVLLVTCISQVSTCRHSIWTGRVGEGLRHSYPS